MNDVIEWLRHSYRGNFHARVLLCIYITNAVSKMTSQQKTVFNHQLVEYNISEISQILDKPRTTIQDVVKEIRRIMLNEIL